MEIDIIQAQYKLQGSCKICGRINRPYTKDDLNGHDEHRHNIYEAILKRTKKRITKDGF